MREHDYVSLTESREPLLATALVACLTWPSGPLARLAVVPATASTNKDALDLVRSSAFLPHMSAFVADHQTAGRGRGGRVWETPAGTSLTASLVLRPEVSRSAFGWVPLLSGLVVVRALAGVGVSARLKWPNDVVVEILGAEEVPGWGTERKVAGILCEAHEDAIVVGVGINVSQREDELAVPHATSLALAGALSLDRGALLGRVVREFDAVMVAWERDPSSAHELVSRICSTIGQHVAVDVPVGAPVTGRVISLSPEGGVDVRLASGVVQTVLAGDVRLRAAV